MRPRPPPQWTAAASRATKAPRMAPTILLSPSRGALPEGF
ncbi:Hypothetical Protein RradSPS_3102 (plasmid) [Rubrobacter radiotolerans]|uniref:Uncharacterized protein n=1 Tax=Rubrobacter radiotolerans TaxID=42256 RepID=A0A023X8M4_RUBRA|nr:Hypothetical Protein RradSPS_3102 [Rubrobacter radiotolerans]